MLFRSAIKSGSPESAKNTSDILTEVGQALVGSWDRVFRKELNGHKSFIQTNVFVGNPWSESDEIKLLSRKKLVLIGYEMTIEPYPTFKCGVIFPKTIFADTSELSPEQTSSTEEKTEKADLDKTKQTSTKKIIKSPESKGVPISEAIRKMVHPDAVPSAQSGS